MPLLRSWRRWESNLKIKFKEGKWEIGFVWSREFAKTFLNFDLKKNAESFVINRPI